jgi:hypothetical protein
VSNVNNVKKCKKYSFLLFIRNFSHSSVSLVKCKCLGGISEIYVSATPSGIKREWYVLYYSLLLTLSFIGLHQSIKDPGTRA